MPMKTEILKIKGSWEEVVDDCRATVSKPPLGHDPRASFKRRILIAEHSPIRDLSVRFRWTGIKYVRYLLSAPTAPALHGTSFHKMPR